MSSNRAPISLPEHPVTTLSLKNARSILATESIYNIEIVKILTGPRTLEEKVRPKENDKDM